MYSSIIRERRDKVETRIRAKIDISLRGVFALVYAINYDEIHVETRDRSRRKTDRDMATKP